MSNMSKRKIVCLLLAVIMVISSVLVGCSSSGGNEPTTSDPADTQSNNSENEETNTETKKEEIIQEFIQLTRRDLTTMDPSQTSTSSVFASQALVHEGLVTQVCLEDGSIETVPGVAKEWEVSEDGLTYTFYLRDNAKWSDGTSMDAFDFEYTWRRLYDPKVGHHYEWLYNGMIYNSSYYADQAELKRKIENADGEYTDDQIAEYKDELAASIDERGEVAIEDVGIKAIDASTFELKLEKPIAAFLGLAGFPALFPVQQEAVEKYGEQYGANAEAIVGNGPFKMVTWEPRIECTFVPNEHYWNKENVHLDKIAIKIVEESNTNAQLLLDRQAHYSRLDDADWNLLVEDTGYYDIVEILGNNIETYVFNCSNEFLQNKKIRQAIAVGFDRVRYCEELYNNSNVPCYSLVPPTTACGDFLYKDFVGNEYEYSKVLEERYPDAKALLLEGLKELGYGDNPDPSVVSFIYAATNNRDIGKREAEWIRQELKTNLGINLEIDMQEYSISYENMEAGKVDMFTVGWTCDYNDPQSFLEIYRPTQGYYGSEITFLDNEVSDKMTELIDESRMAGKTDEERCALFEELDHLIIENAVFIPLWSKKQRYVIDKKVNGFYPNPNTFSNMVGVSIESE